MIRHRPDGRGHPYLVEPDQRVPIRPVAGVAVELRATTSADTARVLVEIEIDGVATATEATLRGPAFPEVVDDYGITAPRVDEGHLGDAVARLGAQPGRVSWAIELPPLEAGQVLRYRFVAGAERTRWFEATVCTWQSDGGDAADRVR